MHAAVTTSSTSIPLHAYCRMNRSACAISSSSTATISVDWRGTTRRGAIHSTAFGGGAPAIIRSRSAAALYPICLLPKSIADKGGLLMQQTTGSSSSPRTAMRSGTEMFSRRQNSSTILASVTQKTPHGCGSDNSQRVKTCFLTLVPSRQDTVILNRRPIDAARKAVFLQLFAKSLAAVGDPPRIPAREETEMPQPAVHQMCRRHAARGPIVAMHFGRFVFLQTKQFHSRHPNVL